MWASRWVCIILGVIYYLTGAQQGLTSIGVSPSSVGRMTYASIWTQTASVLKAAG